MPYRIRGSEAPGDSVAFCTPLPCGYSEIAGDHSLSVGDSRLLVPVEYCGREQSYLKHRVLDEYLSAWGHKLGSAGRNRGKTKLWYVDTFAGPWNAHHPSLEDTSIEIAMQALERAVATWQQRGHLVEVSAIFVEKDAGAFAKLKTHLGHRKGCVTAMPLHGEFGDHAQLIQHRLRNEAAFIFVDPLGWKGAAMKYIAPLARGNAPRDVLVNVMFDHLPPVSGKLSPLHHLSGG